MRTGAYERVGSEAIIMKQENQILVDAAIRACDRMKWSLIVEDVSKWSLLKKLKSKGTIPRLEVEDKVLVGIPTSDEIIQFFKGNYRDESFRIPSS
jgi:hypothetical protein